MNPRGTQAYRAAFAEWLRRGAPIEIAQAEPTSPAQPNSTRRYVWRTRLDDRVRWAHAANEGRVFEWAAPPTTGHPGDSFGCRCWAEPYIPGVTEFAHHKLSSNVAPFHPNLLEFLLQSLRRWDTLAFLRHFYFGGGRTVTLNEIGHLAGIVDRYAYRIGDVGVLRRLSNQIADEARKSVDGSVEYEFSRSYDFGSVHIAHGDATVRGRFTGRVEDLGQMLAVRGSITFRFSDVFTDPVSIREALSQDDRAVTETWRRLTDLGGRAYRIEDEWTSRFEAEVRKDARSSDYKRAEP